MDDREMTELAAKATGHHAVWDEHWECFFVGHDSFAPLEDDGDALRLAVELRFNVYHAGVSVYVEDLDEGIEIQVGHERDKFVATRKAIVLAAAEIGRRMKDADKERK